MHKILLCAFAIMAMTLTGCTSQSVDEPVHTQPVMSSDRSAQPVSSPSPASSPTTPLPSIDPATLICEPPTESVMDWYRQHYMRSDPPLPASDFAMVKVGEGNTPGEDWWLVAVGKYADYPTPKNLFFLTNSPSSSKPSGETWISISESPDLNTGATHWQEVNWPPEKIVVGQAAAKKALSCLPKV